MSSTRPTLVIVSGPPGAGKSTLAHRLAAGLTLPLYSRDRIKEALFDTLGWSDRLRSKQLDAASAAVLFAQLTDTLSAGASCITESNFRANHYTADFQRLLTQTSAHAIQVQCVADGATLLHRFTARSVSPDRHPGHGDDNNLTEFRHELLASRYDPLAIPGPVLTVDTTDPSKVQLDDLIEFVQSAREVSSVVMDSRRKDLSMHALRQTAPTLFETIGDASIPRPATGQVAVRLAAASICGSDLPKVSSTADPRSGQPGFPIHECVGHLVDVGEHTDLIPGQRVLAMPIDECGLAEIYLADRASTHVIRNEHLTDAQATLIQPLATVLYAINKLGNDLTAAHAVVLGLGPIGLLCAHVMAQRGAHVIGVDPVGRDRALTAAFGITDQLQDTASAWPSSRFAHTPVDICLEAVGHQQRTLRDAITMTSHSGTILAMGVPDEADYVIPFGMLLRKNITLKTSITPPWQKWFGPAENYLDAHLDVLTLLLTHEFPVTEAETAFRTYARAQPGRLKVTLTTVSGWTADPMAQP